MLKSRFLAPLSVSDSLDLEMSMRICIFQKFLGGDADTDPRTIFQELLPIHLSICLLAIY